MFSCPRCGSKDGGFFRLCTICEMMANADAKSKSPIRPIGKPDDEDQ